MLPWTVAALLCLVAAQPPQGCPRNERTVSCINLCNDCWSRGVCEQPFCEPGCDCLDGHFRDDWGECVPEAWCPSDDLCGANEVYSDCAVPCNNCDQRGDCDYICEPGCDCKENFHRNAAGDCVHRDSCPPPSVGASCPADEVAVECAKPSWCNTCSLRGNCRLANCTRGCDCRPGHYRDSALSCVPEYKCYAQLQCGPDEQHYSCMPDCSRRCRPSEACAAVCRPGCFCRPGLLRREDGRCVAAEECGGVAERRCDRPDEEFYDCKPFCAATCANRGRVCPDVCMPGCFCRKGLLQRDDGSCVSPEQCAGTTTSTETTGVPDFIIGRRRGGDPEEDDRNTSSATPSTPKESPPPLPNETSTPTTTKSPTNATLDSSPKESPPPTSVQDSTTTSKTSPTPTSVDSSPLTTKESSPSVPSEVSPFTFNESSPSTMKDSPPSTVSRASFPELTRETSVASSGTMSASPVSSTDSLPASPLQSSSTDRSSPASRPPPSSTATSTASEVSLTTASSAASFRDESSTASVSPSTADRTTVSGRPENATGKEDSLPTTKASTASPE